MGKLIINLLIILLVLSFQTANAQSWKELYTKISKYTKEND